MTMRPVYYTFDLADADTDGIADNLTGAGPWSSGNFVATGPSDGFAHQLSLTSAANLSAINITITGSDADGVAFSETLAGPNAATVETTGFFKTVSAVSAASTLGANTLDIGWVGEVASQTIPLELFAVTPPTIAAVLTGTANFDIEVTNSDIRESYSPPPGQADYAWFNDANFTNKSASLVDNLADIVRACRLVVNSYSSGAEIRLEIVTPR